VRCRHIYALGLRRRDRHGVNVRVIQTRLQVRPRIPAIQAAEDAVNFYPCPHYSTIVGIRDDAGKSRHIHRLVHRLQDLAFAVQITPCRRLPNAHTSPQLPQRLPRSSHRPPDGGQAGAVAPAVSS
jgi:hypothetical protein